MKQWGRCWPKGMRKLLDSNLLIRFLLNDIPNQAKAVRKILVSNEEELVLTDVALAEIVWVLTSYYQLPKSEVVDKLLDLLTLDTIHANKPVLYRALSLYKSLNIDFIDAYLAAFAEKEGMETVYSYDEDFDKIKFLKRKEP